MRLRRWPDALARTITVFEGGRLDIPPGAGVDLVKARLLGIAVGGKRAFSMRRGFLYATDLVGAVDVGSLKVEVLPKPYGIDSVQDARQLMFDLLGWAGSDVRTNWLAGGSDARNADLLQLIEQRAAAELLQGLEMGVPRRYHEVHERAAVLRGRIQFGTYARQLPSDQHLLPLRYSPLTADNDLGRLLKGLATSLRDRADSYRTRRDLDRCLDLLAGVKDLPLTPELVRRVRLGRMETDWHSLVELAGMLASGLSPDPTSLGATRQATFLFPMNRLFEVAVRRILAAQLPAPLACLRSPGEHRLLTKVDVTGTMEALSVRPDFLFHADSQIIAAGDAKWKRLSNSPPRFSIVPSDVYQLLAYMRLFHVSTGLLFFPRADWMPRDWAAEFLVAQTQGERVIVLAVDLSELVGSSPGIRKIGAIRLTTSVMAALQLVTEQTVEPAADGHAPLSCMTPPVSRTTATRSAS